MRAWWDKVTLQKYIQKDMIPRGLRLKKIPTTVFSENFKTDWDSILSRCSLQLMELLVKYEEDKLIQLAADITTAETEIQNFKNQSNLQEELTKMQENINKQESSLMAVKKKKFQCDLQDYAQQQVYEWGRWARTPGNPKSIIKKKSFQRNKQNARVNFDSTDAESTDYATDVSEPEERNNANTSYYKNQKVSKKAVGGAEGNTNIPGMQTRGSQRPR